MTTINDTYINALLADSSYVNGLLPNQTGAALATQLTGRMTPELARYIGDNFTVVNSSVRLNETPKAAKPMLVRVVAVRGVSTI